MDLTNEEDLSLTKIFNFISYSMSFNFVYHNRGFNFVFINSHETLSGEEYCHDYIYSHGNMKLYKLWYAKDYGSGYLIIYDNRHLMFFKRLANQIHISQLREKVKRFIINYKKGIL